jgi:hypothetical protein
MHVFCLRIEHFCTASITTVSCFGYMQRWNDELAREEERQARYQGSETNTRELIPGLISGCMANSTSLDVVPFSRTETRTEQYGSLNCEESKAVSRQCVVLSCA